MGRASFMIKLKDDKMEGYKNIHKNVWVELQDTFRKAGRRNYSIWYAEGFVFGYYEADDIEKTVQFLKGNEIVKRWNEYMEMIFCME